MNAFQKFVKRSTKGLFIILIAVMGLSLALWGFVPTGDESQSGDAGIIFKNIKISKTQFNDHKRRTLGHIRYTAMQPEEQAVKKAEWAKTMARYYQMDWRELMRYAQPITMQQIADETRRLNDEALIKKTWEHIILLQDAKDKGIAVSDDEVFKARDAFLKQFDPFATEEADTDPETQAADFLGIRPDNFDQFFREAVMITKLLDLVSQSEFSYYSEAYERILSDEKYGRVLFAEFNPKDYVQDIRATNYRPSETQIQKYYEANKTLFRKPERVQVLYLFADTETFAKDIEVTAAEAKAHYEKHKATKFSKLVDGKQKPIPFEECQEDVIKSVKREKGEPLALTVMRQAEDILNKASKPSPVTIFDEVQAALGENGRKLQQSISVPFSQNSESLKDLEKEIGGNSRVAEWGFSPERKEGDLSKRYKTDKGFIYYRLQSKTSEETMELVGPVREVIIKKLDYDYLKNRAAKAAEDFKKEIEKHGIAVARLRYRCEKHPSLLFTREGNCTACGNELRAIRVEVKPSRYFKLDGRDIATSDDPRLGREISGKVKLGLPLGQAMVFDGAQLGQHPKRDWSFVVFMDDVVERIPDNYEARFEKLRREKDEEARMMRRFAYREETVIGAELQDFMSTAKPQEPKPEPK